MRITVLIGDLVHDHGKWINKSVKTQEKDNNNYNNNNNKVKGLDFLSTWHPSLSIVLIFLSPKKEKEKKGRKREGSSVQPFKVVWDRL